MYYFSVTDSMEVNKSNQNKTNRLFININEVSELLITCKTHLDFISEVLYENAVPHTVFFSIKLYVQ